MLTVVGVPALGCAGGHGGLCTGACHVVQQDGATAPPEVAVPQRIAVTAVRQIDQLLLRRERERNALFNDALNTFYLRLYGVRHMVKDHSDSEKGNPLPPYRLLLLISSKG